MLRLVDRWRKTTTLPEDPGVSPKFGWARPSISPAGRSESRGDDLEVWSDVLRRRPAEAARLTGHPSAAGERIARRPPARRRQPAPARATGRRRP